MKLLCTESDISACQEIIARLSQAGIEAEMRPREPSLFDPDNTDRNRDLQEIWALNDDDAERAHAILYPEEG